MMNITPLRLPRACVKRCIALRMYSAAEIHDAELFDALSRYRMDYRRHRMGAARGGK